MGSSAPQLVRIDLSTGSRDTVAALTRLLVPHIPYSLNILGSILNSGPRASNLRDIDPSNVSLWSTKPLHTTDPLFSIVTYAHLGNKFYFFCSAESQAAPPTEPEQTHVRHVFESIRAIAYAAYPAYNALLVPDGADLRPRTAADPQTILVAAVHAKWTRALAPPVARFQYGPYVRYVFPPNRCTGDVDDDDDAASVSTSEIREDDLPFVRGGSAVPRSDAYVLGRAPYSVCLRYRDVPVACALMHVDGSIGTLYVDPAHRRRGLGKRAMRALMDRMDFRGKGGDDLGGGALGWNWAETTVQNEAACRFLASLLEGGNSWTCYWTHMLVGPDIPSLNAN